MVINFDLKKVHIVIEYSISNNLLHDVKISKDLRLLFDTKLSFNSHNVAIKINNDIKSLGFIKRTYNSFQCSIAFKTFFCSLVRSKLECCALIWSNNTVGLCSTLEEIQNNFLRYITFKFKIKCLFPWILYI